MIDVITFGEALIDLPAQQSGCGLAEAVSFSKVPAGAPANTAVAIRALGLSSAFLSKVGADGFGDSIIRTFAGHGVDTSHVLQDPTARTGLAFVAIADDGEREFLFYFDPARDLAIHEAELPADLLTSCRAFHYGSISLIAEPCRTATLAAARMARQGGALISYDPNLRPRLWPNEDAMREGAILGMPVADVVKVAAEELRFLVPQAAQEAEAAAHLFHGHPLLQLVAMTDGSKGSTGYLRDGTKVFVPGYAVSVVDATGAGDAYVAGLLNSLLRLGRDHKAIFEELSASLTHILSYANACGALATTQRGASAHFLTANAVESLLQ